MDKELTLLFTGALSGFLLIAFMIISYFTHNQLVFNTGYALTIIIISTVARVLHGLNRDLRNNMINRDKK